MSDSSAPRRIRRDRIRSARPFAGASLALLAQLALALVFGLAPAWAKSADDVMPQIDEDTVWNIEADKAQASEDGDVLEAHGDVVLRQNNNYLKADYGRYHRKTHWVRLKGHVRAGLGGDEFEAEEAEFDLKKRVGWLKNGRIFLASSHLYISGKHVQKEWGESYTFKDAKVTACDGDVPAWSFEADEGKVTINGLAKLKGVRFNVKDAPVMYSPFLTMTTGKRESGLLMPGVGYSSRNGATVNVPIYWAINEQNDITLYENFMSARGLMQGIEFRHNWDFLKAKGYWRFDYLRDSTIVRHEFDEPGPLDHDGLIRTNQDRFWLRSKMNAEIPDAEVKIKLDLDFVSDQNYLREFKSGLSGYNKSREVLIEEFSRGIEENDQNRISTLQMSRTWERGMIAGMAQYTQNVSLGNGNLSLSRDPTVQRLPEIQAHLFKDRLPGMENVPLELEGGLSGAYFYRRYGTTGGRMDFHPRATTPIISEYGYILPSVGFRETAYSLDRQKLITGYGGVSTNNSPTRELIDVNVLAGTDVWRVFDFDAKPLALTQDNLNDSQWTKVKHSLQPRVQFNYNSFFSQTKYPYFDRVDRVNDRNQLTYSLTNVLHRKREQVIMRADEDSTLGLKLDYLDFFRLRVENSYDFAESARTRETARYPNRPFQDIMADATIRFDQYISLSNKTWLSPYSQKITEHAHMLNLELPNWIYTSFGFDFQESVDEYKRQERPNISMIRAGAGVDLFGGLALGAGYKYDINTDRMLETSLLLSFKHQCFDITFAGVTSPLEDRVEAWLNLSGLNVF